MVGGKLVHGNVKSSNIFVIGNKYGTVSDVGLVKLKGPIRPLFMPTTGYYAPELTNTRKVSQAFDVYSFGVVLLELITGKPSQHSTADNKVILLVDWINSLPCNERITEVVDAELLRYPYEEEVMVQLLQVVMDCGVNVPNWRPRMPEIVRLLWEISAVRPSQESSLEDQLDDTWEKPTLESKVGRSLG